MHSKKFHCPVCTQTITSDGNCIVIKSVIMGSYPVEMRYHIQCFNSVAGNFHNPRHNGMMIGGGYAQYT